jgi:serine/threonine protein kinase
MSRDPNDPPFFVYTDGGAQVGRKRIRIPNYRIEKYIASGANGIVFRARHEYLGREAAIKIWTKLRSDDRRNKFNQGIEEARKACAAELIEQTFAVRVFDAGNDQGLFYAVMEFCEGTTLADWLVKWRPKLPSRWLVATDVVESAKNAAQAGLIHGDLHAKNIMVVPHSSRDVFWMELGGLLKGVEVKPDIRILDYGTSVFTSKAHSLARHWSVLGKTLNRLVAPFALHKPSEPWFEVDRPLTQAVITWNRLVEERLGQIQEMTRYLRLKWAPEELRFPGDDNTELSAKVRHALDKMVRTGRITVDEATLGHWYDWIGLRQDNKPNAAFDE